VMVWAVRCGAEGLAPTRKSREVIETHVIEDVSRATGGPRFTDQGTIPEGWCVSDEIEEDFVDDLNGYVSRL
jgi:hypothetical protein